MSQWLEFVWSIGFLFDIAFFVLALLVLTARAHVVFAIFWRNLKNYFTSMLGYLFIVVFVTICALLTFSNQFFADNQANLDQLTRYFPWLLLFIVPSITMSIWADEKRQGTDAILFTLPASDFEILLGKYFAAAVTYTIALLFSVTQLIALAWIGDPDWGAFTATYFGYWMAGLAMIAIGMFASGISSSPTMAFVLADFFCAFPAFLFQYIGGGYLEQLSVQYHLKDFSLGMVSLPAVIFFLGIIVFSLYLNLVVITRRHWGGGKRLHMGLHYGIRVISLLVALLAVYFSYEGLGSYLQTRVDMTGQKIYTLSDVTRETIVDANEKDRPVTIQAFVSKNVPQQYVDLKKHFIGLLRQYDRVGPNIHVEMIYVEPDSNEARQARTLGIEPRTDRSEIDGRLVEQEVYMGAHISSTVDDVVLPFIDSDAVEYELTRSLAATTDQQQEIVVGVLKSEAHFSGIRAKLDGVNEVLIDPWVYTRAQREFKKHYKLVDVSVADLAEIVFRKAPDYKPPNAAADKTEDQERERFLNRGPDVLMVLAPSSLSALGMSQLVEYTQLGRPVLVLADPVPFFPLTAFQPREFGIINAPKQPRISPRAPFRVLAADFDPATMQQFPFLPPKADNGTAASFLEAIGVEWENGTTAWSNDLTPADFKPVWMDHLGERWPDGFGPRKNVFVFARRSGNHNPFNDDAMITRSMNEMLFIYPGTISAADGAKTNFEPLVSLDRNSGRFSWDQLTEVVFAERPLMGPNGPVIDPATGQPRMERQPVPLYQTGVEHRRIKENLENVVEKPLGQAIIKTVSADGEVTCELMTETSLEDTDRIRVTRNGKRVADTPITQLADPVKNRKAGTRVTFQADAAEIGVQADDTVEFYRLTSIVHGQPQVLAAHLTGRNSENKQINAVLIADCDFLTNFYFDQADQLKKKPDNIMFLQNCIELLADKTDFVKLRSRRPRARTLTTVEKRVAKFRETRFQKQQLVEKQITEQLIAAERNKEKADQELEDRSDLNFIQKVQQSLQSRSSESKKFEIAKEKLEDQLDDEIDRLKANERKQVQGLENLIKILAVGLAPLPAVLLGLIVLVVRVSNENMSVNPERRRR